MNTEEVTCLEKEIDLIVIEIDQETGATSAKCSGHLSATTTDVSPQEVKKIYSIAAKMAKNVNIDVPGVCTDVCRLYIQSTMEEFILNPKPELLYKKYAHVCKNACDFLGMQQVVAAQFLIKIFDAIIANQEEKAKHAVAGVTTRETGKVVWFFTHVFLSV